MVGSRLVKFIQERYTHHWSGYKAFNQASIETKEKIKQEEENT